MKPVFTVSCNNYQLEIFQGSFSKSNIEKPFIEPSYALFDARISSLSSSFSEYLEVELEEEENVSFFNYSTITINKYLADGSKITIFHSSSKDIKINPDYIDRIVARELKIKDIKFKFTYMLQKAIERLQELNLGYETELTGKFLYEPFILNASPVILVSPMGTGKTLFSIWLAFRIQNGIPLVEGEDKIHINEYQKAKVLYLAFEGNKTEFLEKINQIKNYYLENEKLLFNIQNFEDFYFCFIPTTFYNPIVRKKIRKLISSYKPDLIIIDSVTSAFMSKNELKQAEYLFSYIKNVLEPRNIATLLLMHPSKQDLKEDNPMPKGSILYLAYPRIVWHLTQVGEIPNGFEIEIKSLKDNLGLKKNSYRFEVMFEENTCQFKLTKIIDESSIKKRITDYCLEYLQKHEKATAKAISEYYKLNYTVVYNTLERLVNKEKVIKIGKGTYALAKNKEEEVNKKDVQAKEPIIVEGNTDNIPF